MDDPLLHWKAISGLEWMDGIHLSLTPPTTRAPLAVLITVTLSLQKNILMHFGGGGGLSPFSMLGGLGGAIVWKAEYFLQLWLPLAATNVRAKYNIVKEV